ncbi:MAG: histone deacetylase [Candidatus Omnitrophica bacterium]|nr:histone deacetylase [Candidatus Omnitrophota bacterium]
MKIIYSARCLEYKARAHPEFPLRVKSSHEFLQDKGLVFKEPRICSEEKILAAHSQNLVDRIKRLDFFDPDTPLIKGIFEYALISASSAISAMEIALSGEPAFSLMRPPGHHAGRDFLGGFCYLNNVAIAVQEALRRNIRTAILDVDCHHGNGTQDIFEGQEDVLYVSLHQSPYYPGTGLYSIKNCLNYPLAAGTKEEQYLFALKEACQRIRDFSPCLLAISAGFDTYKNDPLGKMELEEGSYAKIRGMIESLGVPYFSVLEGGYSAKLKYCVYEFVKDA